jgi:DNA-binding winged helix-turn-helix (wHTH) protein
MQTITFLMKCVYMRKIINLSKNSGISASRDKQVEAFDPYLRLSMEPYWKFGGLKYFESRLRLEKPDGVVKLRPQTHSLLLLFLESNGKTLKLEYLISRIWKDFSTVGRTHVYKLKKELVRALGDKPYIEKIPKVGYRFTVEAKRYSSPPTAPLEVFPGVTSAFGPTYFHSWVGHGPNDWVKSLQWQASYESKPRQLIFLSPSRRSALMIPFRHAIRRRLARDSWWSAVVALRVNQVSGDWDPVDIEEYRAFSFEARATVKSTERGMSGIPLKVRFEDDSVQADASGGSFRQSSDWYPENMKLVGTFQNFEVELERFDWRLDARPSNTAPVDKQRVVQVVFGHDDSIPSCAGTIELRRLRLLPRSVDDAGA